MNGYTGSGPHQPAGTVHRGEALLECSCGGTVWVYFDGDLVDHSEPVDTEAEHVVVPYWAKSIWQYQLAE